VRPRRGSQAILQQQDFRAVGQAWRQLGHRRRSVIGFAGQQQALDRLWMIRCLRRDGVALGLALLD
jgi:hypothetical protein